MFYLYLLFVIYCKCEEVCTCISYMQDKNDFCTTPIMLIFQDAIKIKQWHLHWKLSARLLKFCTIISKSWSVAKISRLECWRGFHCQTSFLIR